MAIARKTANPSQDNACLIQVRLLANVLANFEAVTSRGPQVANDGAWFMPLDQIETSLAIFRFHDAPIVTRQTLGKQAAGECVIVDQDDSFHV